MPQAAPASFYYDLASPLAYLAAERVLDLLPGACEWQPVLARDLPGAESFAGFGCAGERPSFRAEIERRARALGVQPLVWPDPFPFDSEPALLAATYAKQIGRAVAFSQAAFRQAFAAGRDLADPDSVLIAAAACEMHPRAVVQALSRPALREALAAATARAAALGVPDVPAVRIGERMFVGERALEAAGCELASASP